MMMTIDRLADRAIDRSCLEFWSFGVFGWFLPIDVWSPLSLSASYQRPPPRLCSSSFFLAFWSSRKVCIIVSMIDACWGGKKQRNYQNYPKTSTCPPATNLPATNPRTRIIASQRPSSKTRTPLSRLPLTTTRCTVNGSHRLTASPSPPHPTATPPRLVPPRVWLFS